jgi:hypothetical protein
MQRLLKIVCLISCLWMMGCGHPSLDAVFNTSTGVYPVVSDSTVAALEALGEGGSGLPTTSIVKIQMQGIAERKMQAVWLQSLLLKAIDGDLSFIQQAKCYLVSSDGRELRFDVKGDIDLANILRSSFTILIEIQGENPTSKVNVSADLKLKTHLVM